MDGKDEQESDMNDGGKKKSENMMKNIWLREMQEKTQTWKGKQIDEPTDGVKGMENKIKVSLRNRRIREKDQARIRIKCI